MPDILIRDVPEEIVRSIDQKARILGLSRTEYLRRALAREAAASDAAASVEDWKAFAERHAGLDNPELMRDAWT